MTEAVYNYSNEGEISWYEFALAIQEIGGFECKISGISSSQYLTPAKRPSFSLLDKSKIKFSNKSIKNSRGAEFLQF